MLESLKRLDLERLQLDEMLAYVAFAKNLKAEHDAHNVEVPEWLDARIRELTRAINLRRTDLLAATLREKEALAARLMPAEERRELLNAEIAALKKELAEV